MYKITVKGEAQTDYKNLQELHGIDCQDEFSEYFDDTSWSDNVSGGYMRFKFEDGKLWTYTVYDSDRLLTEEELEELMDYTQGQWSDGIGEGFEQNPCFFDEDDEEVYVSPWFHGQEITINQEEV
jgi:hypothetical protein